MEITIPLTVLTVHVFTSRIEVTWLNTWTPDQAKIIKFL